jgi:hypothetical protein
MEKQINILIKEFALEQLREEYNYYRKEYSLSYAEEFRVNFFDRISSIAPYYKSFPECRFLPSKNKSYRNIIWNNYLIVFRIKSDSVEVLSLFHTKKNPKALKRLRRVH